LGTTPTQAPSQQVLPSQRVGQTEPTKQKVNRSAVPARQVPAPSQPPSERQIQRRPVAKSQHLKPVQPNEDDDRIRTMALDKVMNKDRELATKMPGYNKEELINDYLQTAVMVPQHDDDY
jgi:hypothetical protein